MAKKNKKKKEKGGERARGTSQHIEKIKKEKEKSKKLPEKEIENIVKEVKKSKKLSDKEKKDKLKAGKQHRRIKDMKEALRRAEKYPGHQVGSKEAGRSIETAKDHYRLARLLEGGDIPKEKIKEGEEVTVRDMIEKGKYYSEGEKDKIKRYENMREALDKAERDLRSRKTKGESVGPLRSKKLEKEQEKKEEVSEEEKREGVKKIAKDVVKHQEDLFRVEKARLQTSSEGEQKFKEEVFSPGWGRLREKAKESGLSMRELENIIKKAGNEKTRKKYEEFLGKKAKYEAGREILKLVKKAKDVTKTNSWKRGRIKKAKDIAKKYDFSLDNIIKRKGKKRLNKLWERELKERTRKKKEKKRR